MKYYIKSILCPDAKFHKVVYDDTESPIDESQFRGGYGNIPRPRSRAELELYTKLKERNEDNN